MKTLGALLLFIVVATFIVIKIVQCVRRSLLDYCPEDGCKGGRLHHLGDVMTSEGTRSRFGCDRCPYTVLLGSPDEVPTL